MWYRDESETLLDDGHSHNFATAFLRSAAPEMTWSPATCTNHKSWSGWCYCALPLGAE